MATTTRRRTQPKIHLLALLLATTCGLLSGGQRVVASESDPSPRHGAEKSQSPGQGQRVLKCSRQSVFLSRQMLAHELDHLNQFNSIWFNDADRDELLEGQKRALSNIVMSGEGTRLLNSNGQPLIELEASYFRAPRPGRAPGGQQQAISIRLLRRHADRCHLNGERQLWTYSVGLSLGPIEHNLDVIYNLPRELQLSQPLEWRLGQISLQVPRMAYEVSFRQVADYRLGSVGGCPLEVLDVTHVNGEETRRELAVAASGLAMGNQTEVQLNRLFDDYTRPAISRRLRNILKFYLNCKTLPLSAAV